jgi:hypothetical protein
VNPFNELILSYHGSRYSSFYKVTILRAGQQPGFKSLQEQAIFLFCRVHIIFGAYPACYPLGTGGFNSEGKAVRV